MRRVILAALALVMVTGLALTPTRTAHADDWCFGDPIVLIGGKQVSINIGVQGTWSQVAAHVADAHIVIHVPQGVSYSLVGFTPAPFTESVQFVPVSYLSSTSTTIHIEFDVTFTRKAPGYKNARVDVTQDGQRTIGYLGITSWVIDEDYYIKK